MEEQIAKFMKLGEYTALYGRQIVESLVLLVVGLILAKTIARFIGRILERITANARLVSMICNMVHFLIIIMVISAALHRLGLANRTTFHFLSVVGLAAVALLIIFRPYAPTLPFKVGNTVEAGGLIGKVEAISLLNTRMKTFDGKTVFVPNTKILNGNVINYHFTPTRRFELEVGIGYDQDLLRAKQILESLMIEDPRVLMKPRPVVYVVNLGESCVELSARGWVSNLKYWTTRCELLEKAKLRLDLEGIAIAFPQRDVHLYHENALSPPDNVQYKTTKLPKELVSETV